jgi:8-oxo-dGTP diphosphatase
MDRPKVGVGVFVFRDRKFLMGRRRGSHGHGEWSLPGGHLEGGESFDDCCRREVEEETGLKIKNIHPFCFTNDIFAKENKHYVTLFFTSDYESGEVENREPEKCFEWGWFGSDSLPKPLFLPLENLIPELLHRSPLQAFANDDMS